MAYCRCPCHVRHGFFEEIVSVVLCGALDGAAAFQMTNRYSGITRALEKMEKMEKIKKLKKLKNRSSRHTKVFLPALSSDIRHVCVTCTCTLFDIWGGTPPTMDKRDGEKKFVSPCVWVGGWACMVVAYQQRCIKGHKVHKVHSGNL